MSEAPSFRELRDVFGQNLRRLVSEHRSVAEVCRRIGINRAQFNRYMNGESYPRPDRLKQICDFFDTDARILTDPIGQIETDAKKFHSHPEISEFTQADSNQIPESALPSGLFRFCRRSFIFTNKYVLNLIRVYRADGYTFMKGVETLSVAKDHGMPISIHAREYRGFVQPIEGGFCTLISQRGGMTGTFNFFTPVMALTNNYWHGYAIRTVPEMAEATRVHRVVFEYLGFNTREILATARRRGFCDDSGLFPFHRRLLNPDEPFR